MDSGFDEKVIYKLATIETQVRSIADNLGTAVHRLEDKIMESAKAQAEATARVEEKQKSHEIRVDERHRVIETRVTAIERYKDNLATRIGTVVSIVALFWLLFGKGIEQTLANLI